MKFIGEQDAEIGERDCEVDYCDSTIDDCDSIYGGAAIPGDAEPETEEDILYQAMIDNNLTFDDLYDDEAIFEEL